MYPTIITFLALFLKDIKPVIIIPMVGKIFLILGPSGSGKGTVMAYLHQEFKDAVFPISCTTRSPRPGEHDGDVYYFLNRDEFQKKIDAGEFLEWAKVHNDNMYGTLKKPILDALAAGKIVIREVDMQGVESIVKLLPRDQVVSIFITAPSWENLRARILGRSKIPESELIQREKSFEREMGFSKKCDFVVMSEEGKIDEFCGETADIIKKVKSTTGE
ncbi:MAG: guanylate kinase [Patescibacteria group bacterium]